MPELVSAQLKGAAVERLQRLAIEREDSLENAVLYLLRLGLAEHDRLTAATQGSTAQRVM